MEAVDAPSRIGVAGAHDHLFDRFGTALPGELLHGAYDLAARRLLSEKDPAERHQNKQERGDRENGVVREGRRFARNLVLLELGDGFLQQRESGDRSHARELEQWSCPWTA
jgi:hypothetical protein